MRLKHILYSITILCALAEIGMAIYAMHWGDVLKDVVWTNQPAPDSELLLMKALNVALPVGILCIALLIWTWKIDAVGGFGMLLAVALHMIGVDINVRAVKKIYGAGTSLAQVTWWAPADDARHPEAARDGRSS